MFIYQVHAIEGVVAPLEPLASRLNRPVYGLQCTQEAPLDSIQDLAKFYVTKLKEVQKDGPYALCGYSFGACVAFEMALQLEKVIKNIV